MLPPINLNRFFSCVFVSFLFHTASFAGYPFSVITLNAWTVPLISKHISKRLKLMPQLLSETQADVIVMQEVWLNQYRENLIQDFQKRGYLYSAFGNPSTEWKESWGLRGFLGNGLLVLSKHPLSSPEIMKFSEYTRKEEYITYKGALYVQVNIPHLGWIDLFVSHLGAHQTVLKNQIVDSFHVEDLRKKRIQAKELQKFIVQTRKSETVLLVADLNTHYFEWINGNYDSKRFSSVLTLFTNFDPEIPSNGLDFKDTFIYCNGLLDSHSAFSPYTYDTQKNAYAREGAFALEPPGVNDYIMINDINHMQPVQSNVLFTEKLSETNEPMYLSDHFALKTDFEINR